MAKRVFFSFHYQDVVDFRANVVRNHWRLKRNRESAGYFDASVWETAKKTGPVAVKRLINSAIAGTSATCVLIGAETWARQWVRYEIMKSFKKNNNLFGVHINSIQGKNKLTKPLGRDPFLNLGFTVSDSGATVTLWEKFKGKWRKYDQVDGSASYRVTPLCSQALRGKGFNLTHFCPTYDWVDDRGYENFADWVDAND